MLEASSEASNSCDPVVAVTASHSGPHSRSRIDVRTNKLRAVGVKLEMISARR